MNGSVGFRDPRCSGIGRAWRLLARIDLASLLLLVLVLMAILASCFPQRPSSVAANPERLAQWERSVRARYGGFTDVLVAVGFFTWSGSAVLWVPTGLLTLTTLACTISRWRRVWRRAFRRPVWCPEAVFDTAAHTAEMNLPASADPVGVVRDVLLARGFRVRSAEDGDTVALRGDRHRLTPMATLITHTAVLFLALGVVVSSARGWRETFTLGPQETAGVGPGKWSAGGTTLQLRSDGSSVTHYPDGSVAGYNAEVTIIEGGREMTHGHIHLNEPLVYRGIGFYLVGFTRRGEVYNVTLQSVRDPGYGLVVAAGLLLFLGLTISLHLPHCCIRAQIRSQGPARVAGYADRRVWDFEHVFERLVTEIDQAAGGRVPREESLASQPFRR